ncbi:serine/threonine protein kinase [Actinomadura graeca]|uniref:Serine/threonine protein kinase n=1 Tax=Actinomadura graeca TaxID=2750812 RepID=A0ABX8R4F7_9ACTN|nr:serine/threonine-protein kinase [Actinomadura graeca]QXJ25950.1 serine/threonine protein kinase [Actinomadura graeca]
MGQVFLGRSPGGRPVAVKLIRPDYVGEPDYRARFRREVQAARRVGGFYTAQVVDADPDADRPWLVTAYIPGPSLQQAVSARGPLDADMVSVLGAGLAEGLGAIHSCHLVHRDLKPANVILAADGPRILDFGIARPLDVGTMTQTGAMVGTLSYMAPEQLRGQKAERVSDVFSLGCVLAFALTGRSPFAGDSMQAIVHHITSEHPDLRDLPSEHGLRDLIDACLAKNPADRPSISDILAQLDHADFDRVWPSAGGGADEQHIPADELAEEETDERFDDSAFLPPWENFPEEDEGITFQKRRDNDLRLTFFGGALFLGIGSLYLLATLGKIGKSPEDVPFGLLMTFPYLTVGVLCAIGAAKIRKRPQQLRISHAGVEARHDGRVCRYDWSDAIKVAATDRGNNYYVSVLPRPKFPPASRGAKLRLPSLGKKHYPLAERATGWIIVCPVGGFGAPDDAVLEALSEYSGPLWRGIRYPGQTGDLPTMHSGS